MSGRPGDDPELRQLVANAARSRATRDDYLALARRFLPRIEPLGGTSNDRIDVGGRPRAAEPGGARWPDDAEVRVLLSRVAAIHGRSLSVAALLEEAQPLLEKRGPARTSGPPWPPSCSSGPSRSCASA